MAQDITHQQFAAATATLTTTQRACLKLVRADKTSKEIARDLGLTPLTVDSTLRDACLKLGVRGRFVAADLLARAEESGFEVTVTSTHPNLGTQIPALPTGTDYLNNEASAGEGNGLGDLNQDSFNAPDSNDSGDGRSWLREPHSLAKFFGGENRLSIGQRLIWIVVIAVIVVIAYGGIVNGLLGISDLLSPP